MGTRPRSQLFDELDRSTGRPVSQVLEGFVDRPGIPWLQLQRKGEDGVIEVRQLRTGPDGPIALNKKPWHVPVCIRYALQQDEKTQCILLTESSTELRLPDGPPPSWVMPNAGALGYYRWDLPAGDWQALVDASSHLTPEERASLPDQLGRSLVAGTIEATAYLRMLQTMAHHEDRFVVQGVLTELVRSSHQCITDVSRPAFQRYVQKVLGPHVRRLGYDRKPDEPIADALLRPGLLRTYADLSPRR